jgi:hypothetical protein
MAWTAVVAAGAVCLILSLKPLHASRLGHRRAAQWLARDAPAPGAVLDTRGWTGLYSGRPTWRYDRGRAAFGHPRLAYVVLERRELEYESPRSRTLARLLDAAARPVATFPNPAASGGRQPLVHVYRWEAERFAAWVASRSPGSPTGESRHARVRSHVSGERL